MRWLVLFTCFLWLHPHATSSTRPGYSNAITTSGKYTVQLSWADATQLRAGAPQQLNASITRLSDGHRMEWLELGINAARRMHFMCASCTTFSHVHVEDFEFLRGQLHMDTPPEDGTQFPLYMTFPAVGRYVVGAEFLPPGDSEEMAYIHLVATDGNPTVMQPPPCVVGPSMSVSHVKVVEAVDTSEGPVLVDAVTLGSLTLPEPMSGRASDSGFSVELSITEAGSHMSMGGQSDAQHTLPVLDTGQCYSLLFTIKDYATGQPVTNLAPLLTHTMHIAVVPLHSLWTVDHFHAMVAEHVGHMDMGDGDDSGSPCDMDDEAMPRAPRQFGPSLSAAWRFNSPGTYRLIAQAAQAKGRVLLPSFVVRVQARRPDR